MRPSPCLQRIKDVSTGNPDYGETRNQAYTVNEVVGVDGSVTYDESIFFVDIAVSLADDGSLVCTVFYPHGEPTFRNVCTAPACV